MSHWLLDAMAERRRLALREADRVQFYREMGSFVRLLARAASQMVDNNTLLRQSSKNPHGSGR